MCIVKSYIEVVSLFEDLFYKRLIALRTAKGVSAREMSLALGQAAGYINRLENRRGFPTMENFFYICDYFHITPKEFFDDKIEYKTNVKEAIDILNSLKPEYLDSLIFLAKGLAEKGSGCFYYK